MIDKFINLALSFIGCGYWWGAKGVEGTRENLEILMSYPWNSKSRYYFNGYSAEKWIGAKMCFDCSGLVSYCLRQLNLINQNPNAKMFYNDHCEHIRKNELQPGDLCFYDGLGHVAIYIGNNQIVHARSTMKGVVKDVLYSSFTKFGRLYVLGGKEEELRMDVLLSKVQINVNQALNIREQPNTNCAILGTFGPDEIVQTTGKTGDWLRIEYQGVDAFIHSKYTLPYTETVSGDLQLKVSLLESLIKEKKDLISSAIEILKGGL